MGSGSGYKNAITLISLALRIARGRKAKSEPCDEWDKTRVVRSWNEYFLFDEHFLLGKYFLLNEYFLLAEYFLLDEYFLLGKYFLLGE